MFVDKLVQTDEGEWIWHPTSVEYDTESDFNIDDLNIDSEICQMGRILLKYGDLAAEQEANLKRKEEYAKLVQAKVAISLRTHAETTGEKMTEGKLSELVTASDAYQEALAQLHILRADAAKADSWWRTAQKKAELLKALAFRQAPERRYE
jgi:hypothetical protein